MATVPDKTWWQERVDPLERLWVIIALLMVVIFFSSWMLIWHGIGRQNMTGEAYQVSPTAYKARVEEFISRYQVGDDSGRPIAEPPPGGEAYMYATRFAWIPILRLRVGETYTLHLSSLDVLHGFSITNPHQWNIQLYPGYEWVVHFTPTAPGVYNIACNDFCGIGHEFMLGKIIVVER